jgi:hypothetical protein
MRSSASTSDDTAAYTAAPLAAIAPDDLDQLLRASDKYRGGFRKHWETARAVAYKKGKIVDFMTHWWKRPENKDEDEKFAMMYWGRVI